MTSYWKVKVKSADVVCVEFQLKLARSLPVLAEMPTPAVSVPVAASTSPEPLRSAAAPRFEATGSVAVITVKVAAAAVVTTAVDPETVTILPTRLYIQDRADAETAFAPIAQVGV